MSENIEILKNSENIVKWFISRIILKIQQKKLKNDEKTKIGDKLKHFEKLENFGKSKRVSKFYSKLKYSRF